MMGMLINKIVKRSNLPKTLRLSLGHVLVAIALCFGPQALANEGDFKAKRQSAIKAFINSERTEADLLALKKLARKGDVESLIVLGTLHLSSEKIKSFKKAEGYYLSAVDAACHPRGLVGLNILYTTRGSALFNPSKYQRIANSCKAKATSPSEKITGSLDSGVEAKESASQKTPRPASVVTEKITNEIKAIWSKDQLPTVEPKGGGSSVAINEKGYFLTNHHVVDQCDLVSVTYNGMSKMAALKAWSEELDLALILAEAPTPYFAKFDLSEPRIGEELFALGFPVDALFGKEPSFAAGYLTNADLNETLIKPKGFLLVSIPLASGNSGGPVYSKGLGLRGISTMGYDTAELANILEEEEGIKLFLESTTLNFMVSGNYITRFVSDLGVSIETTNPKTEYKVDHLAALGNQTLGQITCY